MEQQGRLWQAQVRRVLDAAGIPEPVTSCAELFGGYSHRVYDLNDKYILRIACEQYSGKTHLRLAREREVLEPLRGMVGVPQVLGQGTVRLSIPPGAAATPEGEDTAERSAERPYLLLTKLPGEQAFRAWLDMSAAVRKQVVEELVALVRGIHATPLARYTIGFHQTALQNYNGTWLDGHDTYMRRLLEVVRSGILDGETGALVEAAEAYYATHRMALAHAVGPRLIHGDLHLANVIVDGGRVSGLVDWEWAGGGEPDIDLAHLVRWAWFPAHPAEEALEPLVSAEQYLPLIPALLEAYAEIGSLPRLWERLTIYEIEYDLHQLTQFPRSTQARERLRAWLHACVLQTKTEDFSPCWR